MARRRDTSPVLVLAGGSALGSYQAGAYAMLHRRRALWPEWICGSSIGAVNAALIAGNAPELRIERLEEFWKPRVHATNLFAPAWQHAQSWSSVIAARLFGVPGRFCLRLPGLSNSFYDQTPVKRDLERLIDFDRLNGGPVRVSVVATDIETGEMAVFDTARGNRIGCDHLLASSALLPDFAPVEIDGRSLADGGLVANAPVDVVLAERREGLLCFLVDLFSARGPVPGNLEEAAERRMDLIFANQTEQVLRNWERSPDARSSSVRSSVVFRLAYRPTPEEAGPGKAFDFSQASAARRWRAGERDMAEALRACRSLPRQTGRTVRRFPYTDKDAARTTPEIP